MSPATPSRHPVPRPSGPTLAMPGSTCFPERPPRRTRCRCRTDRCRCVATSYGERFSYLPEARPAMAIDGDPNTAWTVLDPTGQYLEVRTSAGVDHVTVLQPNGLRDVRRLETITVTVDGGDPQQVVLDERSLITGQLISFPATDGPTTIRIALGRVRESPTHRRSRSSRPDASRHRRDRRRPRRQPGMDRRSQRPHVGDGRRRTRSSGDLRPHS